EQNDCRGGKVGDIAMSEKLIPTPAAEERTQAQLAREAREAKIRQMLRDDDELLGKAYDSRLVRRLFLYMSPYKASLILAVILMTTSSILGVSGPAIIGFAIDNG